MSPITHLLLSWSVADESGLRGRDRTLVVVAGLAPDLDGLPVVVDLGNRLLGRPETFYYGQLHHWLLHGLPAALLVTAAVALAARRRLATAALALAVLHLHLLCDLVGARGPAADDFWPVYYLAPVSWTPELVWAGQWALNAWPNILLTLALLALALCRGVERGETPLSLVSRRADRAVVETLRRRFAPDHLPADG
jgi:inner membrane protein